MTNSKSAKKVLLGSVLSFVLCFAMLLGTTFAWFTDSVTSAGNKIQSGNLKIDLVDAQGVSLEGKIIDFVAEDGRDSILWEPGCTYNTEEFYIENKGNLNLKFKFIVNGITGDAKLLEVIDFTAMANSDWFKFNTGAVSVAPGGEEFDLLKGYDLDTIFYGTMHFDEYILEPGDKVGPIVLSGHMREDAGIQYQKLAIEGISITLIATQATGEEDSFDGIYDETADYPIADSAALTAAMESAQSGDVIALASGSFALPAAGINEGVTIAGNGSGKTSLTAPATPVGGSNKTGLLIDQANVTIKNAEIQDNSGITNDAYYGVVDIREDGTTLDSVKVTATGSTSAVLIKNGVDDGETVTIKDSILTSDYRTVYIVDGANGTVKIDNTDITGVYTFNVNSASSQNLVVEVTNSKLHGWTSYGDIKSASFTDTEFSQGESAYNFMRPYADTTLTRCTFKADFKLGAGANGKTYIIDNCNYDGTDITAENVESLLLEMTGNDGTCLKECTIIVNGTTVVLN